MESPEMADYILTPKGFAAMKEQNFCQKDSTHYMWNLAVCVCRCMGDEECFYSFIWHFLKRGKKTLNW